MDSSKVCASCQTEKPLGEFRMKGRWRRGTCAECDRKKNNEYSRRRNEKDRERVRVRNAEWAIENREYNLERKRKYNREHRDYFQAYARQRRKVDVDFRLRCVLRCRLRLALKGLTKSARTMDMLGCSTIELKKHLESKWSEGMTWETYGGRSGWQIDHIIPCAAFDLSKPEEQGKCFHYTNLQPLWADENRQKHTKLVAA